MQPERHSPKKRSHSASSPVKIDAGESVAGRIGLLDGGVERIDDGDLGQWTETLPITVDAEAVHQDHPRRHEVAGPIHSRRLDEDLPTRRMKVGLECKHIVDRGPIDQRSHEDRVGRITGTDLKRAGDLARMP